MKIIVVRPSRFLAPPSPTHREVPDARGTESTLISASPRLRGSETNDDRRDEPVDVPGCLHA